MLKHGGRLREAAARYGMPIEEWLDLSTGINPDGFPAPPPPPSAWSRLPEDEDGLEAAARAYYGTDALLAVAGSQAAIQALAPLRGPCRVAIISPGYAEHAYAWRRAGHQVAAVPVADLGNAVRYVDVLVVINPNNPTGDRFPPETLLDWHARLAARGGWLVVDEAFIDPIPADSLAPYSTRPGPSSCARSVSSSAWPARAWGSCWPNHPGCIGLANISAPGPWPRRRVGPLRLPWRTAPGKRPPERNSSSRPSGSPRYCANMAWP